MNKYDIVVIGGGGAGLSAAFTAAGFGKKTLLVEKYRTGGECTWNGCIPSKALIHLAELHHAAAKGVAGSTAEADSPFDDIDAVRQAVYAHESPEELAGRGVETLIGTARFTGRDTIEVNGRQIRSRRFVLAVGSRALVPPIPGLADTPHLTNENLFDLRELPKSALVMGGGPIGLELAQALNRLGVDITVVEMMDRILFREDEDAAAVIRSKLEGEGVRILTGSKASKAVPTGTGGAALTIVSDGEERVLEAEALLVAVGRGSAVEGLGLEAAGVSASPKGVEVNRTLRTANRRIYAAGDVAGPYAFSHMAEYQGVKAAMNAILPIRTRVNYDHVAWCTFTDPEIARAGLLESEARKKYGTKVRVYTQRFENLDRGRTAPGTTGLVKIIIGPRSRVVGAHIAGPRAGELISEIQVIKSLGIGFHRLRNVIHPYPTYADILRQIAKRVALDRILQHPMVRIFRRSPGDTHGG